MATLPCFCRVPADCYSVTTSRCPVWHPARTAVFEPATVTALAESPFNDQRAAAFPHRNIIAVIGALVALADHVLDNCVPVQLLQFANLLLFFVGERLFVFALHETCIAVENLSLRDTLNGE